ERELIIFLKANEPNLRFSKLKNYLKILDDPEKLYFCYCLYISSASSWCSTLSLHLVGISKHTFNGTLTI
ncbi:unnamed protein product, partial [Allacma fusca]